MGDQVEKCSVNNIVLLDKSSIKIEEFEGNGELENYDKMKQYEISNDIKTEFLPCKMEDDNMANYNIKTEKVIIPDNIKIQSENRSYCEHCDVYYEDYCIKCGMLVRILNKNTANDPISGERIELPDNILEIQNSFGQFGIFALKVIPQGVKFGPFTGFSNTECLWKNKEEKFVANKDETKYLNWMKYINPAKSPLERNLLALQCDNNLYYQSLCEIQVGDELLVHFGDEYEDSLNKDVGVDSTPRAEHTIQAVFACTFCCLGFSSVSNLVKHKTVCFNHIEGRFTNEELTQCSYCKIYLYQKEYFEHHMTYCSENNDRKHKEVSHLGEEDVECSASAQVKEELPLLQKQMKQVKCCLCEFRTKYKRVITWHIKTKHLKKFDYNCESCDYKTNHKTHFETHIKSKHLIKFDYKCDTCHYKTNHKSDYEKHMKRKHLVEFIYNCESCDYKTNYKSTFEKHMKVKHLEKIDYKCGSCDYKTNYKSHLEMHIKTKHLVKFDYMCELCDYKTNHKSNFGVHMKSNHLKKFDYNCESCDYKTNKKPLLEMHVKSKHLVEFDYKCEFCPYKVNCKSAFKKHTKTKHLLEFDQNRVSIFEKHIKCK